MKIGRVPLMKTQIKKLKPLLDRAEQFNQPPYEPGFILIGQVEIPDNVNGLEEPWLKVVMLTDERAKAVHDLVMEKWGEEL